MRLTGPLVFEAYFREQVWGGRRLETQLNKRLPASGRFGESWEISGHPHHVSRVAEGSFAGQSLTDLWNEFGGDMADGNAAARKFPLLIKYLDCHELLSVQVHPNDAVARELLGDELGKTEAWVVLASEPEGRIFAGLKEGVCRAELEQALDEGTVDQCLHCFHPSPGDCVFLRAGTVHAVGGGVVLAEVQQSSDATFRLFDWNRLGPDGKPRTLHKEQALRAIDWSAGPVLPVANRSAQAERQRLVECDYFTMDRFECSRTLASPYTGRMTIWMVLGGRVELRSEEYQRAFETGDTVLIPAACGPAHWTVNTPSATLLAVTTPD